MKKKEICSDNRLTQFFLSEARKHKRTYLLAVLLMPVVAVLAASGPKVIQLAVDKGMSQGEMGYLLKMVILYLVLMLLRFIIEPIQSFLMQTAGVRTLYEMRVSIIRHICRLGKGTYDRYPIGVLVARATSDIEVIGDTVATNLVGIVTDLMTVVTIIIVLFFMDVKLGVVTLILLPIVTLIINWFRVRVRALHETLRGINGRIFAKFNETLSMRSEVLNFHLSQKSVQEFSRDNLEFRRTAINSVSYDAGVFSVMEGLSYISIGMILFLASQTWFMNMTITIGAIVMYILYLQQLFTPFRQLGQRFTAIQATYAALNKINSLMQLPVPNDAGNEDPKNYELEINRVRFSYEMDYEILKGISFAIPERHSLAIVGPTGSGKTTIARILTRQYEINSGSITLGGVKLEEISRETLKKWIILVPQDPTIIDGNVIDNITLGQEDIPSEKIIDVCRKLKVDNFINQLSEGYATNLSTGGINFSMGQKQLIALARAYVSDAKILIFDESTSNIDTETEIMIQESLKYIMTQKTTIIIAHRLSTIHSVNQILVLKNGHIEEKGTHDELLTNHGLYRKLYSLQ